MLNIAGKIFTRILLNRLNGHLERDLLLESQCGFRRHRGTTDMISAARQLQDKCQKMRTHLYTMFMDLTKAFDMVNRDGLWKVMQKFGCPEQFTHMSYVRSMLMDAYRDEQPGIRIAYRTDGQLMDAYRDEQPVPECGGELQDQIITAEDALERKTTCSISESCSLVLPDMVSPDLVNCGGVLTSE
ncbi:unnamed protein product [Schistocephalus solidus]|uniref:Reverse transcriptase domain-containing protein n=1 Tax=Schistocephalus solidus TaxID=70667 RepID=A0A3P7DIN2_SCHSO|nr:unnamed protein product [Schistocephalus solidus]